MKSVIAIFLLQLFNLTIVAQGLDKGIQNQLNILSEWHYDDAVDIDSLVLITGKYLVTQLEREAIDPNPKIDNLQKISSQDSLINVYTFSYYSHGTRGTVNNPVIQWVKSNGSFGAYELFPANKKGYFGLEVDFYEIHKLPSKNKTLYLLIGTEREDSQYYSAFALVIRIVNDYLILDYPAFYGKSSTLGYSDEIESGEGLCVACIEYSHLYKTLSINDLGEGDRIGPIVNNRTFEDKVIKDFKVIFKFDGTKFIEE